MGSATKKNRLLDIFYRALRGEELSVCDLAKEYQISRKSISRDITEIKNYLSDNRESVGHVELKYNSSTKKYFLEIRDLLSSKEVFYLIIMIIGSESLPKKKLVELVSKLRRFTTLEDRRSIDNFIGKRVYEYEEGNMSSENLYFHIWKIMRCIEDRKTITLCYKNGYSKIKKETVVPKEISFTEHSFYLIAMGETKEYSIERRIPINQIANIVEHRKKVIDGHTYVL